MIKPKLRCSLSVEKFKEGALKTWDLQEWKGNVLEPNEYVLFFGLYTKNDYDAFKIHQGKKSVFWCGSDIQNLKGNYESRRLLKLLKADHFCENEVEQAGLKECGVEATVIPSFLDDVNKYPASYVPTDKPHIWLCGHAKREREYGWELIEEIAEELPEFTFHLYGVDRPKEPELWEQLCEINTDTPNIIYHGKVSEEQFNKEIRNYHCGLRPNEHDGFSEVIAKSILLGQYPISKIPYEKVWSYNTKEELIEKLKQIKIQTKPNFEARTHWLKKLNTFPWVEQKKWA